MSLKSATFAQVLRGAGYAIGIFGKWHQGDVEPYQPGGNASSEETSIHGTKTILGLWRDCAEAAAAAPAIDAQKSRLVGTLIFR